jgi:hypothetical protein
MTARDAQGSITPGSVPYGERQNLEQGLQDVLGGQGVPPGGEAPAGPPPIPAGGNPLEELLSGGVSPEAVGNVTDGLSVGAGPGPTDPNDPMLSDKAKRLRLIAEAASTPSLRATARRLLKRMSAGREPL